MSVVCFEYYNSLNYICVPPTSPVSSFYLWTKDAPVRDGFSNKFKVNYTLSRGAEIKCDYAVTNDVGNLWYHIHDWDKAGWIYGGHITKNKNLAKNGLFLAGCPVNVKVYDTSNTLAASIIDGELYTYDENKIIPYKVGSGNYFEVSDNTEYRIEIDSLSEGLMDYTIETDFDEVTGKPKNKKEYTCVPLEENEKFSSTVGGEINTNKVELNILDEKGNAAKPEYLTPVSEDPHTNDKNISPFSKIMGILMVVILVVVLCFIVIATILVKKSDTRTTTRKVSPQIEKPKAQAKEKPKAQSDVRFCPICGALLNPADSMCKVCGNKLRD